MALDYPIWLTSPKEIDITKDEFYKLSGFGISSLWCSFKVLFHYTDNGDIKLYTHNLGLVRLCIDNYRFKGINWRENESVEMYNCIIPKEYKLTQTIEKYYKNLIMKQNSHLIVK